MHDTGLIETVAQALGAALVFGYGAKRIGLSPILGYLVAGIVVGPYTPGLVADLGLASQLAEIGVVLLMFGVGLHFSLHDLMKVRAIAIPGAIGQSAVATVLGLGVALSWGWTFGEGLVFGVALAVASTVVLVRGLEDRRLMASPHAHAAVGWLIVEDLLTVLLLVLLPALSGPLGGTAAGGGSVWASLGLALGKVAVLATLVLAVGSRVIPWLLVRVARVESRELFTLAVLAIALGIAYGSALVFDVSMALGAFLAGMVVAQSDLSHRAGADALPLRDAFAVLFFVSVGMLFDPSILLERPGRVVVALAVVMVAKPLTAVALVLGLGFPVRTAVTAAVGLAQIGEFSFILAALGRSLGLLPEEGQSLLLATAILSIALNPFLFRGLDRFESLLRGWPWLARRLARRPRRSFEGAAHTPEGTPQGHAILCGHGRVGSVIAEVLNERGWRYVVIEQHRGLVERLNRDGVPALNGDAGNPILLDHAGIRDARLLLVALSDPVATALVVAHARRTCPDLPIVVQVDSDAERRDLLRLGRVDAVVGTQEAAFQMVRHAAECFGLGPLESEAAVLGLRERYGYAATSAKNRFVDLEVSASGAAGKRIADLGLPPEALIVAVRREGEYVVPGGKTELREGDHVLALLLVADVERVERLLRGEGADTIPG